MSNEERIQQIRERESKAPKGPWVAFPKVKYGEWHVGIPASNSTMKVALCPDGVPGDDDAEKSALAQFIANSREDVPFLLSELPQTVAETIDLSKEAFELLSTFRLEENSRPAKQFEAVKDRLKSFVQRIHSSVPQEPTQRERELLEIIDTMTAILGPSSQGRFRRTDKIFGEIMDLRTRAKFPAEWKAANPSHSSVPNTKLLEALEKIRDHDPRKSEEYVSLESERLEAYEAAGLCEECIANKKRSWPPSGLCNVHYSAIHRITSIQQDVEENYGYRLKLLAESALTSYRERK